MSGSGNKECGCIHPFNTMQAISPTANRDILALVCLNVFTGSVFSEQVFESKSQTMRPEVGPDVSPDGAWLARQYSRRKLRRVDRRVDSFARATNVMPEKKVVTDD